MKAYRGTMLTALACAAGLSLAACSGGITTSAPGSPSWTPRPVCCGAPRLDSCLVGTWKGVHQVVTNWARFEPAEFAGPGPASLILRPDYTGTVDFGAKEETLTGTVNGHAWTEVVTGSDAFTYQTSNDSLLFSDVQASDMQTLYKNGIKNVTAPLTAPLTGRYTCSGNTLRVFATGTGSTEFTRIR